MGLDHNGTRFLLYARSRGVDFSRTAMLGRQTLTLSPEALAANLRLFHHHADAQQVAALFADHRYAEPFLRLLGAREAVSFDVSNYENATVIHDFNQEIDTSFHDRFTVVLDGGSLEHIFNFPVAVRNCMNMVQPGGYFLGITPANNAFAHGFYQFSSEVFYRIFSEENGFHLEHVFYYETKGSDWYEVADSPDLRDTEWLTEFSESYLLVMARKVNSTAVFTATPQQSIFRDALWINPKEAPAPPRPMRVAAWRSLVPMPIKRLIRRRRERTNRLKKFAEHFRLVRLP